MNVRKLLCNDCKFWESATCWCVLRKKPEYCQMEISEDNKIYIRDIKCEEYTPEQK